LKSQRIKEKEQSIRIIIRDEKSITNAVYKAKVAAQNCGFSKIDSTLIATVASELARNVLVHGSGGEVSIVTVNSNGMSGVEIIAEDKGPGIPDVEQAFKDGYSTRGTLGVGLPAVKRIMDEVEVSTGSKGTRILSRKWIRR